MSYHGREWDQGKDWGAGSSRLNIRERDGDNSGDWKRRKFNNGDYSDGFSSKFDDAHADYGYNDYSTGQTVEERARAPQNRKRHVASEPSPHVIFLGLDTDFTEADLSGYLQAQGCVLETVTIIRDRNTGISKGFGFAQFKTIENARSFVDPNFPFVSVPPPASHGASALAAYNQSMASGGQHGTRRVKIDYSQSANPPSRGRGPQFSNDGTRDIGNTQAAVLLFRGLDPLSGPAAVAQAIKTSSGLGKDGGKGMKRVLLVKDKATLASWGFAFVEFVDIQCASAVLACTISTLLHPNGFRISDRPVAASFAHPYSFQILHEQALPDDACVESSVALGGADGMWSRYWDEQSTLAVMNFSVEESTQASLQVKEKEKKDEKKKTKVPGSYLEGQVATGASSLPVSDKPVTLSFNKNLLSGGKAGALTSASKLPIASTVSEDLKVALGGDENEATVSAEDKVKTAQKVPPLITSKKIVKNITKWQQVQEELSNTTILKPSNALSSSIKVLDNESNKSNEEVEFEFSDTKNMICLLCARQFKTTDQLKRHNKESGLHKKNYTDKALCDVAKEKKIMLQQQALQEQAVKYRDRASERRIFHNQPDAPILENKPSNKRHAEGPPTPPSPPPPPPTAPGKDQNNIGNKMLKLMGWTEGRGLGSEGDGRVDPIETAIYVSGAGLGASKGKEIGKYTEGYTGYVHMAKDAARERYGQQ